MEINKLQEDFIQTASRFGRLKYEAIFHDISKREYEMLTAVERFMNQKGDGKGVYVTTLAGLLKVSTPAVSRMLGVLEEKGYLERNVDLRDRRNTCVYLTESGMAARKRTEDRMRRLIKGVLDRMGEEEIRQLLTIWNRLADILEDELKGESYV